MAQPARTRPGREPPPIFDPAAIDRAYRFHRARRHARLERRRETRLARLRFWLMLGALLLACLVVVVTIWVEIEHLFGL
jgi:hypothetical protein